MFDFVKNRQGKKIFVVIDHPKGNGPFPCVLLIHGFTGFSTETHIAAISDALVEKGFLVVRPDLTKNPGRSYLDFSKVTYSQEIKDTENVLNWVLGLSEVDKNRIGIAGHSLAGMIVAEIASKRREVKALGILSGVYSFKLIQERIFKKPYQRALKDFKDKGFTTRWSSTLETRVKISKSFYENMIGRSADKFAKKIQCPALIIAGEKDEAVSKIHSDSWQKNIASKDKTMKVIKGSKHVYTGEALVEVEKVVGDWFRKKLL